jgi:hypothetical protein
VGPILLRSGADPSRQGGGLPFSPLDAAIASDSPAVIQPRIEAGADLEARGRFGLSAPNFAAEIARRYSDFQEIAILLRQAAGGGSL